MQERSFCSTNFLKEPESILYMTTDAFYAELIEQIAQAKPSKDELSRLKHSLCKKYGIARAPTDIDILLHVPHDRISTLRPFLQTKPVRTGSGVVPLALMTKPLACPHGKCTYCPGGPGSVRESVATTGAP